MRIVAMTFLLVGLCLCTEPQPPGIVGTVGLDFLNRIKDIYFSNIVRELNNMKIDEVNDRHYKLWNIDMTFYIPLPEDLILSIDAQNDGLRVQVRNMLITGKLNWKVKLGKLIKIRGHADIKGVCDEISIVLGFTTQERDGYLIPAVFTKSVDVSLDKHKWHATTGNNVIQKVGNTIIKALRGPILKKVKQNCIIDSLNKDMPRIMNEEIRKSFEIEAPLTPWLNMNFALVSPIKASANSLILPINGTIYLPGSHLNFTHKPSEIMLNQKASESDVSLAVGDYVFSTFADSLNQFEFEYNIAADGYDIQIAIPGNSSSFSIVNTEKGLHVVAKGNCTVIQTGTSFDVDISGDLSFNFTNGDGDNMLYFNPIVDKNSLNISTSNVFLVREKLGLGMLSPLFGPIIGFFAKRLEFKSIPVKKIPNFPLVLNYSSTEFTPNYMAVRLDV
ncbi:unnamed protein product [Moneuplotes crassus]|uniref:Uncharacterized protein n=1 Tax=Euplotes crassus TaxID=5936 RepID=A0AAD1UJ13_EUPCR|nr:unnamed protein product [Moneuplotes crassus]